MSNRDRSFKKSNFFCYITQPLSKSLSLLNHSYPIHKVCMSNGAPSLLSPSPYSIQAPNFLWRFSSSSLLIHSPIHPIQ